MSFFPNIDLGFPANNMDPDIHCFMCSLCYGDHIGIIYSRKNIINNLVLECGEIENTEHLFLHCNLYGQLKNDLLDRVSTYCQPTVNVFLYGNSDVTDDENAELFSAVQHYILKTKRFCQ